MGGRAMSADNPRCAPVLLYVVNVAWFFVSHRLHLAVAARAAGYEVHVAAAGVKPADVERIESAGVTFHPIPFERGKSNPGAEAHTFVTLLRLYRPLRPAIVHHVTVKPVLLGTLAARLARVPRIINAISGMGYLFTGAERSRSLRSRMVLAAYRALFASPRVVVLFQNADDRDFFIVQRLVKAGGASLIEGSGVDPEEFRSRVKDTSPVTVVLPARMLWDKGVAEFREAARILRAAGVEARFLLAGDLDPHNPAGVPRNWLDAAAASGDVEWLGHQSDMATLLGHATIVCLPSYREGLPKALLEASACECAIVTTDVPGCRTVVKHEVTGLLVPPREAKPLAEALRRVIEDPALRARLGRAARQRVETELSARKVSERTLALYSGSNVETHRCSC